jgi:Pentapeptide repeats (8 copies)
METQKTITESTILKHMQKQENKDQDESDPFQTEKVLISTSPDKTITFVSVLKKKPIIAAIIAGFAVIAGAIINSSIPAITAIIKQHGDSEIEIEKRWLESKKQIENKNSSVKIAGIIDMERIVKDSPGRQWDMVRILTNSIHLSSPAPKNKNILLKDRKEASLEVKQAIEVIKNRNPENDNVGKGQREAERIINLTNDNLFGTDLEEAQLPRADLSRSDLTNIVLSKSNLRGAFLRETYLRGADLSGVDLAGADLQKADLMTAILKGANLTGANLKGTKLKENDLTDEQIKKSCNWELAEDDTGRLEQLQQENTEDSKTRSDCKKW